MSAKTVCYFLISISLYLRWDFFPTSSIYLAEEASRLSSEGNPKLEALLDKVNACTLSYYKEFRQFVAEESQIQKRYDRKGHVVEERTIISDYYVVSLPSDPEKSIEFRDTLIVDGKKVHHDPSRLSQLFRRKPTDMESEIHQINRESSKYYIANKGLGDLANTWYRYASPECRNHTKYQVLEADGQQEGPATLLQFQEAGQETLIHFKDLFGRITPIPARGSYLLSGSKDQLAKVDITVFWGADGTYKIGRWIREYKPGPAGVVLPSLSRTVLYQGHSGRYFLETESTYSGFRRFSTDVKLLAVEPIETAK